MTTFERQWQSRFEKRAGHEGTDHFVSGWSEAGLRRRLEVFEDLLERGLIAGGGSVLELGCGAGTYVRLLAKSGHPVVGLDYSVPSLGRAVAADPAGRGRYLAGDAYALPFAAGAFDAVVCIGVLQTLTRPEAALAEMARVLAPRGVLLVEGLNPWSPPAAWRRLASRLRGRQTRLRYTAPAAIERGLRRHGVRPARRVPILLPPRSLAALEAGLGRPWVGRMVGALPGLRAVAPHALWVIGAKA